MSNRPVGPVVLLPPAKRPSPVTLEGRTTTLIPLRPDHAEQLFPLVGVNDEAKAALWDYMSDGPFSDESSFQAAITAKSTSSDPFYFVVIDNRDTTTKGQALGYISLMNIIPQHLSIEIGNVLFSPALQRTTCATEAVYLLLKYTIEVLGYRRVEWKCNALNAPSRRAALRLGFTFEGVFRQHMVIKGRSRDTAWFSLLREEWEDAIKETMQAWLEESNFDQDGKQKKGLEGFRTRKQDKA
ncbi:GNAT family N-acetyltransferase [Aspergillus clavatus NRRL 1]|uniref:Acetyltransferase, GNAT family, putative n=1 Tax=Aspergillus clavatus (strain ATCC 1007 / CBS 513.65 / DSM 816 / NCTC 3887 / NRRL 1 / QM 1276 / 107) TaxID=344612 RepID=A1CGH4_ASPCL|nr:acetyltransferase, GNAT family, putative [Aspergillus clavatus NRRL 1]EAW11054.1 acetyltransferase, GNAT family, putative [Aspergillus clavatus NRRL 1]